MLSGFVIGFLLRGKCLNFMAAVILEPKKRKSVTVSIFSPSICHEVMGLSGHEFERTPGDSEGQRRLACCNPWGHKVSDRT